MQQYDAIVIGAGNGGLACAATLAEKGKKVILFEKHNIPGGCGTSFRRGRFEFEVALHQLSSMGTPEKPGPLRELFRRYGIEDQIEWIEIKELFRVNFPDGTGISIPADRKNCEAFLCSQFPQEKESILRYFKTVYAFCSESAAFAEKSAQSTGEPSAAKKAIMKMGFPKMYPTLARYALKSTQEVLDEFFKDVKLQLALSAYWCFMGMPPARFPWSILAKCTNIYMEDKPFYLRGTSMMMNQAIMDAVQRMGGVVHLNRGVKRIVLEGGAAVGVVDEKGEEYRASKIISNISPLATYGALLQPEEVPQAAQEYLRPYTIGISALTCFIGLDCTPEEIGFTTSFTLNYESFDANEDFKDAYKLLPEKDPLVATCYTVDDPEISPPGTSIITAGTLKYSAEWEKLTPEQYYEKKYEAGKRIVARLEKMYPGFTDHIEEIEVATPLTHMRYLNHPGGAIYGYEQDVMSSVFFFPAESKIPNLEFASGWVNACGFGPNYLFADKVATKIALEV
ncbi:NAD(P)/FAD-dependent oxidoreductase [Pygmaiobacter massiliensis]|uniref:phytoene desaturase family protein n=1 Tax=Pygmaiobacter massiliensis TaxID=1917873 RepID=UPI002A82D1A5|nr:NAD(P)/FAD-dependent oxidoreductase [Pygmaiobacter massiliensis]MDY4783556.1 NAD(P)/FAD-dependent oxidoreductase [Pygmaiobacter massiliensis]